MMRMSRGWTLLGVAALLLALAFACAWLGRGKNDDGLPSVNDVRSNGMKAAYMLLTSAGRQPERLTQSLDKLPQQAAGVTVFDFDSFIDDKEVAALRAFAQRGGRVVTAAPLTPAHGESPRERVSSGRPSHAICQPSAPSAINRGGAITMGGYLAWPGVDGGAPLYQDENLDVVVAQLPIGRGDAIWLADALPLSNAGLLEQHNVDFLFHLVEGSSRVIFYEKHLQAEQTEAGDRRRREINLTTQLFVAQFLFAALLMMLARTRRAGPLASQPEPSRQNPLEFVRSLGALYHKAGAQRAAVEIALGRLRRLTRRRVNLPAEATAQEWAARLREQGCSLDENDERQLAEAIGDEEPKAKKAVEYVRFLNRLSAQMERRADKA